jgi:hypothetical protein
MKANHTPLWWRPPFLGNQDRAVDQAAREYITQHRDYYVGGMLAFLSRRVPELRRISTASHSHRGNTA